MLMRKVEPKAICFHNSSRSYDETAHVVRFWGYDQTLEVSFFIEEDALTKMSSNETVNTRGILKTFDLNLGRIREMASILYARRRAGSNVYSFVLTENDFE